MSHYPVNLDLKGRRCVIVGGGPIAERKAQMLLDFGAAVGVIAPELTPRLHDLAENGLVEHTAGVYMPGMLDGAFLVIAATDDRETNKAVSSEAQRLGILVNVVDDPELCTFFVPAILRRGDFIISISTSGRSPALARRVREELESRFGPEYGELADLLGELRDEMKARHPDPAERYQVFLRILDSGVLDLLAQGKRNEAIERARKCI
ncbi:MAG TPA: bifunctional precorrin-2 dehydrogenase/sirohydrochlorin ferrochelatase [Armatimonadota bacterium]|nr:bifunctional precorrin-2 dehydrogenase/sirohydrochlorin ferrochelatase [Armatimonadota bacterium]